MTDAGKGYLVCGVGDLTHQCVDAIEPQKTARES